VSQPRTESATASNDIPDPGRDYGTGLILFGILDVSTGVLFLAKTVVFLVLALSASGALPVTESRGEIAAAAIAAGPAAAFFLAVGFGSMVARRWARSLSVAFSAVWLAVGSAVTAFLFVCLPRFSGALRAAGGPGTSPLRAIRAGAILALVGVGLPAAYLLFYRARGVKAECERRDPDDRWTDRVPPVHLAAAVVLSIGSLLAFGFAFSTSRQIPLFGSPLGTGVRAAIVAAAAVQALAAWGICLGRIEAWPAAAAIMAVRAAANVAIGVHVSRTGLAAVAARLGALPPESRASIERLEALHPLRAVAAFLGALSIAAFVFVAWTGFRAVRASRGAPGVR